MKKTLTILLAAVLLLVGCQKYSGGEPVDQESKKAQTEEKPQTLTLEDKVANIISEEVEKETFKGKERIVGFSSTALDEDGNSVVNIELNADERGSIERAVDDMHENAAKLFPAFFNEDKIIEVGLVWFLPLIDGAGNEETAKVMQIRIKKDNNINWDSFDYNNFENVADQYYLHDALKEE